MATSQHDLSESPDSKTSDQVQLHRELQRQLAMADPSPLPLVQSSTTQSLSSSVNPTFFPVRVEATPTGTVLVTRNDGQTSPLQTWLANMQVGQESSLHIDHAVLECFRLVHAQVRPLDDALLNIYEFLCDESGSGHGLIHRLLVDNPQAVLPPTRPGEDDVHRYIRGYYGEVLIERARSVRSERDRERSTREGVVNLRWCTQEFLEHVLHPLSIGSRHFWETLAQTVKRRRQSGKPLGSPLAMVSGSAIMMLRRCLGWVDKATTSMRREITAVDVVAYYAAYDAPDAYGDPSAVGTGQAQHSFHWTPEREAAGSARSQTPQQRRSAWECHLQLNQFVCTATASGVDLYHRTHDDLSRMLTACLDRGYTAVASAAGNPPSTPATLQSSPVSHVGFGNHPPPHPLVPRVGPLPFTLAPPSPPPPSPQPSPSPSPLPLSLDLDDNDHPGFSMADLPADDEDEDEDAEATDDGGKRRREDTATPTATSDGEDEADAGKAGDDQGQARPPPPSPPPPPPPSLSVKPPATPSRKRGRSATPTPTPTRKSSRLKELREGSDPVPAPDYTNTTAPTPSPSRKRQFTSVRTHPSTVLARRELRNVLRSVHGIEVPPATTASIPPCPVTGADATTLAIWRLVVSKVHVDSSTGFQPVSEQDSDAFTGRQRPLADVRHAVAQIVQALQTSPTFANRSLILAYLEGLVDGRAMA